VTTSCLIEFYSGSDEDEGRYFEGSIRASASGEFSWKKQGEFRSEYVTATASFSVIGTNTSEFSNHVSVNSSLCFPIKLNDGDIAMICF